MDKITYNSCDEHKAGDKVFAKEHIKAENGYTYECQVPGTIVKRRQKHIGADFHIYQVLFDKPRYSNDNKLVIDMIEYDLRFA